ncbi:MAG: histidine--tRNA ligase [Myxococcales bacterium]|nr:histidine--tRNA ligase [Myxococcales bacterium]
MPVFAAKGTRDLLPAAMHSRLRVIQTIREVYAMFGFEPIETPAMERVETLMGKYGEEGDRLIFKILERGEGGREGKADLALRYDLTVPLARVIAMNQGLPLPFKRYQIQPVWRADRPQKGRFREFYQCDGDIVGSKSLVSDAECIAMAHLALERLGFADFVVHVNHRALLRALVAAAGVADRETDVLIAVDKLDKIGRDGVTKELLERGIPAGSVDRLWEILARPSDLDAVEAAIVEAAHSASDAASDAARDAAAAAADLRTIFAHLRALGASRVVFDGTLARGLGYYTGAVYEVKLEGLPGQDGASTGVGTVAAGGRYDGLIGMFSGKQVPAVGISIGLERILTVMEERGMLTGERTSVRALVTMFSPETQTASLELAAKLRAAGVPCEVWLGEPGALGKQFRYADQRGIPYALVLGPDEIAAGTVAIKSLGTGDQERVPALGLAALLLG